MYFLYIYIYYNCGIKKHSTTKKLMHIFKYDLLKTILDYWEIHFS